MRYELLCLFAVANLVIGAFGDAQGRYVRAYVSVMCAIRLYRALVRAFVMRPSACVCVPGTEKSTLIVASPKLEDAARLASDGINRDVMEASEEMDGGLTTVIIAGQEDALACIRDSAPSAVIFVGIPMVELQHALPLLHGMVRRVRAPEDPSVRMLPDMRFGVAHCTAAAFLAMAVGSMLCAVLDGAVLHTTGPMAALALLVLCDMLCGNLERIPRVEPRASPQVGMRVCVVRKEPSTRIRGGRAMAARDSELWHGFMSEGLVDTSYVLSDEVDPAEVIADAYIGLAGGQPA